MKYMAWGGDISNSNSMFLCNGLEAEGLTRELGDIG